MAMTKAGLMENNEKFWGWNNFVTLYHEEVKNGPIWFLLCLFIVNIYFYIIFMAAKRIGEKGIWLLIILPWLLGCAGYFIGKKGFDWHLYTDTALTALPFFSVGYLLNRKTNFLRPNKSDKYIYLIILACLVILVFLSKHVNYANNAYQTSLVATYACGFAGTLGVILISKLIKHLPGITYIGRYSIVILCIHQPVAQTFITILGKFMPWGQAAEWTVFLLTVITCALLTPLIIRYLPHVTAQKDVI